MDANTDTRKTPAAAPATITMDWDLAFWEEDEDEDGATDAEAERVLAEPWPLDSGCSRPVVSEEAMLLGMGLGIDAFNDANGNL